MNLINNKKSKSIKYSRFKDNPSIYRLDNRKYLNLKFCKTKYSINLHNHQNNHFKYHSSFNLIFKLLSLLNWKFNFFNFNTKCLNQSSIGLFLIILLSFNRLTNAQSSCPNTKQINDLKPLNINLNCDCTQTADGQKSGWEIMCYSVENLNNANSGNYFKINEFNLNF